MFGFSKPAKNISDLITARATERDFQRHLKSDFSSMVKRYVHAAIQDEWIRFSEYPIGRGRCDFAIFTDRSRMHVILFEIKGADFDFSTIGETFAKPISKAIDQMLDRFQFIEENYHATRMGFHTVRKKVEKGKKMYASKIGANGYLHVDPDKHIVVKGVVIGGRTRDDVIESNLRHKYEKKIANLTIESWDSWLRKAQ